jgi:hypothetical protein
MVIIDREDLAELREQNRAQRDELQADLERRQIEDPDLSIPVTREAPQVIRKVHYENHEIESIGEIRQSARQMTDDDLAWAFAETRNDMRKEFETRIAVLEARIDTLLTVLGSDTTRAKSVRARKR